MPADRHLGDAETLRHLRCRGALPEEAKDLPFAIGERGVGLCRDERPLVLAASQRVEEVLGVPTGERHLASQDTVQSRTPDPEWLDRWLDTQIRFDAECEQRVVRRILKTLSALFGEELSTVRELGRYRKAVKEGREGTAAAAAP